VLALTLLLAGTAAGSGGLKLSLDSLWTNHVDTLGYEVDLAVTVTDASGYGVTNLDSTNFSIEATGLAGSITPEAERASEGVAIAICVDISGSMPVDKLKRALVNYMSAVRSQDRVAIVTFAGSTREPSRNSVEIVSGFTNNISHLRSQVNQLEGWGNRTELYQGIYEGLKLLRDQAPEDLTRRYLLVFSDGYNEYVADPTYELNHCVELARETGVTVLSVAFSEDESYRVHFQSLRNLADRTNGSFYETLDPDMVGNGFTTSLRILESQYHLSYLTPDTLVDSREHEYTLRATSGSRSGTLTYTEEFEAPPEEAGFPWLLLIIIVVVALIIAAIIVIVVRRRADEKIDVLNEELLKEKDRLAEVEKERQEERLKNLKAGSGAGKTAVHKKPKDDKKAGAKFRQTMIGSGPRETYSSGKLLIVEGEDKGREYALDKPSVTIGHAKDNDIVLDSSKPRSHVSGHHAVVKFAGGQFQLVDRNSSNGTRVNGRKITQTILSDGDKIHFAKVQAVFKGVK